MSPSNSCSLSCPSSQRNRIQRQRSCCGDSPTDKVAVHALQKSTQILTPLVPGSSRCKRIRGGAQSSCGGLDCYCIQKGGPLFEEQKKHKDSCFPRICDGCRGSFNKAAALCKKKVAERSCAAKELSDDVPYRRALMLFQLS